MSNPFFVEAGGAYLPARVCRDLENALGKQLGEMRVRSRGVDQEKAFALLAIRQAALGFVPLEEQKPPAEGEQPSVSEWMNTSAAAELLGLGSPRSIRVAIERGRLKAHQVDGRWRINRTDLESYRKDTQWHR